MLNRGLAQRSKRLRKTFRKNHLSEKIGWNLDSVVWRPGIGAWQVLRRLPGWLGFFYPLDSLETANLLMEEFWQYHVVYKTS